MWASLCTNYILYFFHFLNIVVIFFPSSTDCMYRTKVLSVSNKVLNLLNLKQANYQQYWSTLYEEGLKKQHAPRKIPHYIRAGE